MKYQKPSLVILSGAGISQESGIATFRDADGLWEGHDVMEVATPQGWNNNPALVLDFYNKRRAQLLEVEPNEAHHLCYRLEKHYDVHIITQNVDDLHERAGSTQVLHLHGELLKARSSRVHDHIQSCRGDINLGDLASDGSPLRPHIVWFGEDVPLLEKAVDICAKARTIIIVGTSLQVYPAASLYQYARQDATIYYVDPNAASASLPERIRLLPHVATTGMQMVYNNLVPT